MVSELADLLYFGFCQRTVRNWLDSRTQWDIPGQGAASTDRRVGSHRL